MAIHSRLCIAVVVVSTLAPCAIAAAQLPDSARRTNPINRTPRMEVWPPDSLQVARIDKPTLVVVAPEHAPDTLNIRVAGCAAAKAAHLACARIVPRGRIVDRRHAAISILPDDLKLGYVIMAPAMRPLLLRGAVAPAVLADSIRAYMRVYDRQFRNR